MHVLHEITATLLVLGHGWIVAMVLVYQIRRGWLLVFGHCGIGLVMESILKFPCPDEYTPKKKFSQG